MKANTVKNDMVEASSEAELRTSERGMGLGIDVVGGGEAEVTLKTRAGWHFANGASEQTVYKSRGATVLSLPLVGDNSGAESGGRVPVGGTEDPPDEPPDDPPPDDPSDPPAPEDPEEPSTPEDPSHEEGSVEHTPPVLTLSVTGPRVVAYYVLDGKGMLSVTLTATLLSEGVHDPDGEKVKFSPDSYHWEAKDAKGAILASQDTEDGTAKMDVWLSRNGDVPRQTIVFSVVGECDHCGVNCDSSTAEENFEVSVYELSIDCDPYLGLDMTDAGREKPVTRTATVKVAPGSPSLTVNWVGCGDRCAFVDRNTTNKAAVRYQNKPEREPSKKWLGERLEASVRLAGMESSVSCVTNFTVVKVDTKISGVEEELDEKNGTLISYASAEINQLREQGLTKETVGSLKEKRKLNLTVAVSPELPEGQVITVEPSGVVLISLDKLECSSIGSLSAGSVIDGSIEICARGSSFGFLVYGNAVSSKMHGASIKAKHECSSAADIVRTTCYGFEFVTPKGDPLGIPFESRKSYARASVYDIRGVPVEGQNQFTFFDEQISVKKTTDDAGTVATGVLDVYLKVRIVPSEIFSEVKTDGAAFSGRFKLENIEKATPQWGPAVAADRESECNVSEDGTVKMNENGVFEARARFVGYPEKNSSFGRKVATFYVEGRELNAEFAVFFQKYGVNHPRPLEDICLDCPNWFYYWSQKGVIENLPESFIYSSNEMARRKGLYGEVKDGSETIYIYPEASGQENEFEIESRLVSGVRRNGFRIGKNRRGLGCFAAILAHEEHHLTIRHKSVGLEDNDPPLQNKESSRQGDGVADVLETNGEDGVFTDPTNKDTYEVSTLDRNFADYAEYGDNEIRARIIERVGKKYDKDKDWSDPGFQNMDQWGAD